MEIEGSLRAITGRLPAIHLIVGILTLIVFLGTGQYMLSHFPEIFEPNEVIRYQFRANHIYILFSSLLNIVLGLYGSFSDVRRRRNLQLAGSLLLVTTPILLTWAFFVEPVQASPFRTITSIGVDLTALGVLFHLLGGLRLGTKKES